MNNGKKPIANPYVILREEFDDWAVLFDPDTGRGFGLSPTGVYVWKLLDGEHTIDDLLGDIGHHADSVPEDASDHIRAFVDGLIEEGLAALDNREWSPEKRSHHSAADQCVFSPFTYEPPRLVNLNSERAAHGGSCSFGSVNTFGSCGQGNHACGTCSGGTSASYKSCCTGPCDDSCTCGACKSSSCNDGGVGVYCHNGTTVDNCNSGGTAGYCQAGTIN